MDPVVLKIDGIEVKVTHPDRVLFPADGLTKLDLARYYADAARVMAPHIARRLITVERYPQGASGDSFYQRHAAKHYPSWMHRESMIIKRKKVEDVTGDPPATMVYLANLSCITVHTWLSRVPQLNVPDIVMFDLDPSTDDFAGVRKTALDLRKLLTRLGLKPFVKTTGSRGLHVVAPVEPVETFDTVRRFAERVALHMVQRHPRTLTVEFLKKDRHDRIFIDTVRNAYGASAVAPYSVRARPGAPIARPISWKEVENDAHTAGRPLSPARPITQESWHALTNMVPLEGRRFGT